MPTPALFLLLSLAGILPTGEESQTRPAAPAATGAATALTVTNQDGVARTFSRADLEALPQVSMDGDDPPATFTGPTLRVLLTAAAVPEGHALRGRNMLLVVVAEARDDYRVVYSLAELDEQFGARTANLALTRDGQPLAGEEGPLRVVAAGEMRRARWIRQVERLRVIRIENP